MHPFLVKVLPASVRREYYEWVDYKLPLLFSKYWIYRLIYKVKCYLSPSFRREEERKRKQFESLLKALSTGSFSVAPGELKQGCSLEVESLSSVMERVTFDTSKLKFKKK